MQSQFQFAIHCTSLKWIIVNNWSIDDRILDKRQKRGRWDERMEEGEKEEVREVPAAAFRIQQSSAQGQHRSMTFGLNPRDRRTKFGWNVLKPVTWQFFPSRPRVGRKRHVTSPTAPGWETTYAFFKNQIRRRRNSKTNAALARSSRWEGVEEADFQSHPLDTLKWGTVFLTISFLKDHYR